MNRYLRTAPTPRLLGTIAGILIAIGGGTAIALAARGSGPVPRHQALAAAIRQALAAPALTGVSGSLTFTNNLISSSEVQGSDPLLSGGSGRFWITPDAARFELQGDNGDANAVIRNGSFWAYDPASNTVYEGRLPSGGPRPAKTRAAKRDALPTVAQIQRELTRLAGRMHLSGAIPSDVAGRPTYTLRVSPEQGGGLLGAAQMAWDAVRGVPLRFALYARGDSSPVLSIQATGISYGSVSSSVFEVSPPSGAKVVHVALPSRHAATAPRSHGHVAGLAAVRRHLGFALDAPASLAGRKRTSVSLLGSDGALVIYGRPLGGVAVIEQAVRPGSSGMLAQAPSGGDQPGLTLPTVSVGGASAQELDTALGSVVRFQRAGVAYTVLGSVRPALAVAAARGL